MAVFAAQRRRISATGQLSFGGHLYTIGLRHRHTWAALVSKGGEIVLMLSDGSIMRLTVRPGKRRVK